MFWAKKSLATTYSPTAICRSTIGAGGLNFRVRNGNGWILFAMTAVKLIVPKIGKGIYLPSYLALFYIVIRLGLASLDKIL